MSYIALYKDFEEPRKYNRNLGVHDTEDEAKSACKYHAREWFVPEGSKVDSVEINWELNEDGETEGSPSVIVEGDQPIVYRVNRYRILLANKRNIKYVRDETMESEGY